MKRGLKVFFRCHPDTPVEDLKKLENKKDLVLWIHGGKYTPQETKILADKAAKAGFVNALDLGQKTRIEKIHEEIPIGSSGPGRFINVGSAIILAEKQIFQDHLSSFQNEWPNAIIAQINRLPQTKTKTGEETEIYFGEKEVACRIDQEKSFEKRHLFLTVYESHLGKIFSDHGVVGGTYSLEENRESIFSDKDIQCLETNKESQIEYLILSFVENKDQILNAYKIIDQFWPGWRQKKESRIIIKLETSGAVENIKEILSIDKGKTVYMIGLGDLSMAIKYKKWELDQAVEKLLKEIDKKRKKAIVATGICVPMLPPDAYMVLPWQKDKLEWLENISKHPSVFAIGTTSESIRASQRKVLGQFLNRVRSFS